MSIGITDFILVFILLMCTGLQDIKDKEINIIIPLLIAGLDLLIKLVAGSINFVDIIEGAAVGVAIMILSTLTGAVGMGDGIVLLCTGVMTGFERNMELFFSALLMCGTWGLFLMLILKKSRKTKVPFVPFLLAAFGITEIMAIGGGVIL